MAVTSEQARAELARRELARRQAGTLPTSLTRTQRVEQEIAQRPSAIRELNFPSSLSELAQSLGQRMVGSAFGQAPPVSTPFHEQTRIALPALAAGKEIALGVPSAAILAIQQGRPQEIGQDIGKVLTGERPVGLGNVFRQSGLPGAEVPFLRFLVNNPDFSAVLLRSLPAVAKVSGLEKAAKGVSYTRLFKGGQKFAKELEKSPATVNLTEEAETFARARSGVNPALRKQVLSKAEQTYQNLTGKTPVEDLLNARGQVGVSQAHDVANLTSQNLAKSYFERLGEALRGGNELQQLGLKAAINRKIVAADPALKELYRNYSTGRAIDQFVSMLNPFGIPLKLLSAIKRVR